MKVKLRFRMVLALFCAMAFLACNIAKNDDYSFLLLNILLAAGEPAIGENYQGGKIAYIFQPGDPGYVVGETHGLIAATEDETGEYQWKTSITSTPGTSTALGTGYANTYTYMTGAEHPAAEVVRNATHGGYNDWYLPSQDELNILYENRAAIGGPYEFYYWSSSEYDPQLAWFQYFNNGEKTNYIKNGTRLVRAVRAF